MFCAASQCLCKSLFFLLVFYVIVWVKPRTICFVMRKILKNSSKQYASWFCWQFLAVFIVNLMLEQLVRRNCNGWKWQPWSHTRFNKITIFIRYARPCHRLEAQYGYVEARKLLEVIIFKVFSTDWFIRCDTPWECWEPCKSTELVYFDKTFDSDSL